MISTYNFLSVSPAGEVGLPEEHTSLNDGKLSIDRNSQIGHPCPWNEKFPEKKNTHSSYSMNSKKRGFQKKKLGKELEQKVVCWFFFARTVNSVRLSNPQSSRGPRRFQAVSITVKLWSPKKKKTSRTDAPEVLGKNPMSVFRPKFTFAIFPMSVVSELSIGVISQNQAKYINQRS